MAPPANEDVVLAWSIVFLCGSDMMNREIREKSGAKNCTEPFTISVNAREAALWRGALSCPDGSYLSMRSL